MRFYAYPNPANDKINLCFSKKTDCKIRLLTLTGQTVLINENVNEQYTLDVKNITAGLYIIEATDIKTKQKFTKKIIVSK